MNLRSKKEIVAKMLDIGVTRVLFNPNKLNEIKEAITRQDFRKLMVQGVILVRPKKGVSRGRARHALKQKRKGRQHGQGSREGRFGARVGTTKQVWVKKIRAQRDLIKELLTKSIISKETYIDLRKKAKGGYFRNVRHIKLYLTEKVLWIKK